MTDSAAEDGGRVTLEREAAGGGRSNVSDEAIRKGAIEGPREAEPSRAALARVAGRLRRIFRLPVPDAPGLVFIGGTAAPDAYGLDRGFPAVDVSGRGMTVDEAFAGCVGEAVEHLSSCEWGDEPLERRGSSPPPGLGQAAAAALLACSSNGASDDWMPARRLGDGLRSAIPASLCLRRPSNSARRPAGAGCAAGESWEAACLAALLELIERDAAALWWQGGRPALPVAPEAMVVGLGTVLDAVRGGATQRRTWFLDLTTDLDVPAIAALSVDLDGSALACGLAARTSVAEAARAAFLELCQMELANRVVALKLERDGPEALSSREARRRGLAEIDTAASLVLATSGPPRPPIVDDVPGDASGRLAWLLDRLARHGIECLAADLTRPAIGVPAVRVVAPLLQDLGAELTTERLVRTRARHRERARYLHDTDLI